MIQLASNGLCCGTIQTGGDHFPDPEQCYCPSSLPRALSTYFWHQYQWRYFKACVVVTYISFGVCKQPLMRNSHGLIHIFPYILNQLNSCASLVPRFGHFARTSTFFILNFGESRTYDYKFGLIHSQQRLLLRFTHFTHSLSLPTPKEPSSTCKFHTSSSASLASPLPMCVSPPLLLESSLSSSSDSFWLFQSWSSSSSS